MDALILRLKDSSLKSQHYQSVFDCVQWAYTARTSKEIVTMYPLEGVDGEKVGLVIKNLLKSLVSYNCLLPNLITKVKPSRGDST